MVVYVTVSMMHGHTNIKFLNAILNLQNLELDVTKIANLDIRRLTCTIHRRFSSYREVNTLPLSYTCKSVVVREIIALCFKILKNT